MQKSTKIFVFGNLVVMSIPLFVIGAILYKINTGDIIDRNALREGKIFKSTLEEFDEVVITNNDFKSRSFSVDISIKKDTKISADTSILKYISYKVDDKKLSIHYDFKQDSIDNFTDGKHYNKYPSTIKLSTLAIKKISTDKVNFMLYLPLEDSIKNGIVIDAHQSYIGVEGKSYNTELKRDSQEVVFIKHELAFKHVLQCNLDYSTLELIDFERIQQLDIDLQTSTINIDDIVEIDSLNLSIDKASDYTISVHDLSKTHIIYK